LQGADGLLFFRVRKLFKQSLHKLLRRLCILRLERFVRATLPFCAREGRLGWSTIALSISLTGREHGRFLPPESGSATGLLPRVTDVFYVAVKAVSVSLRLLPSLSSQPSLGAASLGVAPFLFEG
jgi:hypothetical protein